VLTVHYDWEIEQMDIKSAYLQAKLDKEVYMKQPPGFDDHMGQVCQLLLAL